MKNIIGEKYNRLLVIDQDATKYNYWICECDCGNIVSVRKDHLVHERIKSCGCYAKEVSSKLGKIQAKKIGGKNKIDITNVRFGRLIAIEPIKNTLKWKCVCDCGAEMEIYKSNLLQGHTTSCGCNLSNFEYQVALILKQYKHTFTKNKTFSNCRFDNDAYAKFDFFVDNQYIIECDGLQHINNNAFPNGNLTKSQQYDIFKNNWCHANNIPIIRIPYKYKNDITIEDLVPNTSKFLI